MRIGFVSTGSITLVSSVAAAATLIWSVHALWVALYPSADEFGSATQPQINDMTILDEGHAESGGIQTDRLWPALFGEPMPEPPGIRSVPTVEHMTYTLKGLVTSGEMRWAIVTADGADSLVQEGDDLPGGAVVEEIQPEGVWLRIGEWRKLVAFSDKSPVNITSVEIEAEDSSAGSPKANRQQIQTQSLSPLELRDIILKAEADRTSRGVTVPGLRVDD